MAEIKFSPEDARNEIHKLHLGNLMVQIINLQAELEVLKAHFFLQDGTCAVHSTDCGLSLNKAPREG